MTAEDYLARARALASLLERAAPLMERERQLTGEVVAALHEAGLYRLLLPRSVGGAELNPADFVEIIEEIAKTDASTAWCLAQAGGCATAAAYLDPAVAREVFAPRDAVVAWGPPNRSGSAAPVDGGFILNGRWEFASGSRHATWLGAHAARLNPDGSRPPVVPGRVSEPTFLFPRSEATIVDTWRVIGLKATGSDSYEATNLFVPARHMLQRDDPATRREPGPLYRFTNFQLYGAAFAGVALGIARRVQDEFVALAREKTPFTATQPLRDNASIQSQIALNEVALRQARLFLLDTLRHGWDEAAQAGEISLDRRVSLRLGSTAAIHQAKDLVDGCYLAAGATAIFEDNRFERRFRDMHAVSQQAQARMLQLEATGRLLLGFDMPHYAI